MCFSCSFMFLHLLCKREITTRSENSRKKHFEVVRKWAATKAVMLMDGGDSINLSFWDDDEANGVLFFWWIVVWGR